MEHPVPQREQDGSWIQTFTGRRFWPLDPRPEDVAIEDIAHALSLLCRYNGHVRRFYSVGEHSLLLCWYLEKLYPDDRALQLQALMHDAAEAYLADIPRPVKPLLTGYYAAEARVEQVIQERFGLMAVGNHVPRIGTQEGLLAFEAGYLAGEKSINHRARALRGALIGSHSWSRPASRRRN